MGDDVKVDKAKFDSLLGAMLSTPPLPKSEVKVKNPKPKKYHAKEDFSDLPSFVDGENGVVIAALDADGNLAMAVDPTTLPPDLFRKLFPSGRPGITPETVRLSIRRSVQSPMNRSELERAQRENRTHDSVLPNKVASPLG